MDYNFIAGTKLFEGVSVEDAEAMLRCLGAQEKSYSRGEVIYHAGQCIERMGLLLEGGVNIVRPDIWGNENIIGHILPGEVFAETYACSQKAPMMADVIATTKSTVLFLDVGKVIKSCASSCSHHARLVRNLLMIMASKNLNLAQKINHITPKSIRERLLSYLSSEAVKQGKKEIEVPFNRQQLADYLAVDRSALSNELSKMQKDGLLSYHKNHFILRQAEAEKSGL